jgi:hypothetical protein
MGKQLIRQPNGKFGVWSTVSDGVIMHSATKDQLINEMARKAAEEAAERVRRDWTQAIDDPTKLDRECEWTAEEAIDWMRDCYGDEAVDRLRVEMGVEP